MYTFSKEKDLEVTIERITRSIGNDSLQVIFIDNLKDFGEQCELHKNKFDNVIFVVEENIRYKYDIGRIPKHIKFSTYDSRRFKSTDSILTIFDEGVYYVNYVVILFINFSKDMQEDIRKAIPMFNYSRRAKLVISD